MLKNLLNMLKSMEGNISISGDTDILVLENAKTVQQGNLIKITGFDEELGETCFIIAAEELEDINTRFGDIELHKINGNGTIPTKIDIIPTLCVSDNVGSINANVN